MASASKDGEVRVWDVTLCQCVRSLSSHTASVSSVRWGGTGLLYTASQDRTIKVWRAQDGTLCRTLQVKRVPPSRVSEPSSFSGSSMSFFFAALLSI